MQKSTSAIRRAIWPSDEVNKAKASASEDDSKIKLSLSSESRLILHA